MIVKEWLRLSYSFETESAQLSNGLVGTIKNPSEKIRGLVGLKKSSQPTQGDKSTQGKSLTEYTANLKKLAFVFNGPSVPRLVLSK